MQSLFMVDKQLLVLLIDAHISTSKYRKLLSRCNWKPLLPYANIHNFEVHNIITCICYSSRLSLLQEDHE